MAGEGNPKLENGEDWKLSKSFKSFLMSVDKVARWLADVNFVNRLSDGEICANLQLDPLKHRPCSKYLQV